MLAIFPAMSSAEAGDVVTYEAFGAVGDGVHDDLPAIRKAHEHANAKGLPVRSNPQAIYHLGRKALTVIIATDTDWSDSRFTIDGLHVDDSMHPENYEGMFLFSNPGGKRESGYPFPYAICRKVKIRGLTTASGKKPRVSSNARVAEKVVVVGEG